MVYIVKIELEGQDLVGQFEELRAYANGCGAMNNHYDACYCSFEFDKLKEGISFLEKILETRLANSAKISSDYL